MNQHLKNLPPLDKQLIKPLYVHLSEILANYIQVKRLKPQELMPSEKDLIQRYGVSRMTARLALQRLEAEGLVRRIQGKGTFVASPKQRDHVRGFQDLEQSLAQQGRIVTNVLLELADVDPPSWAQELSLPEESKVRIIRRLKMTDGKPLALEVRVLPLELGSRFTVDDFKGIEDKSIIALFEPFPDMEFVRVTYTMFSSLILESEAEEMGVPQGIPVLVRKGIYYNREENPFMVAKVIFLGNRIDLLFEFCKEDDNWAVIRVT